MMNKESTYWQSKLKDSKAVIDSLQARINNQVESIRALQKEVQELRGSNAGAPGADQDLRAQLKRVQDRIEELTFELEDGEGRARATINALIQAAEKERDDAIDDLEELRTNTATQLAQLVADVLAG